MTHVALVHHHVGGKAGGGGGVRLMLELGVALQRAGHRVTVTCHDYLPDSEFSELSSQLDVRAVRRGLVEWPRTRAALVRRYWRDMPQVARLVPADVEVVNGHEWPGSHAGRLAAQRLGKPFVWTRNDETGWERAIVPRDTIIGSPRLAERLVRGLLGLPDLVDARRADAIVVLAERQARMVRSSYRRDSVRLPLGPSRQFFAARDRAQARHRLGVPDGAFLAVSAAILFPHRRFEDLIEAVALLRDEIPGLRALLLGSDHGHPLYADRLSALVRERGLEDRVELPRSRFSDNELADAYAAADVFVWPAQRQTWGLAPLEALAAGTPVIVSSGAGVHELLAGRGGVQIVAPERPAEIARAIARVRAGEGRDGIEATRTWLRDEHDIDRYAGRMIEVYERAAASRPSALSASRRSRGR